MDNKEQIASNDFITAINELFGIAPAKAAIISFYGDSKEEEGLVTLIKENSIVVGNVGSTTIYKSNFSEADWKGYFAFYPNPVEANSDQCDTLILQVFPKNVHKHT